MTKTIKVTLDVTLEQLTAILDIIDAPTETSEVPTRPQATAPEQSVTPTPTPAPEAPKPILKKGGVKAAKMPGFGRTTAQIAEFAEKEAARVGALDEEEEERKQRKADKEASELKAQEEVTTILEEAKEEPKVPLATKKPWAR